MDPVPTQYIDRDGAAVAYQVVGDGPVDVVFSWDIAQHLDLSWTDPDLHHIFERGASYSRTIHLQPRGFGLSDRLAYVPTLEQQAGDVVAIMDAVGVRRATLCGFPGADGPLCLVAANTPERVDALVLVNTLSQGPLSGGVMHGWTESELADVVERYRHAFEHWGSGEIIDLWDSVQASPYNRRFMGLLERSSATPVAARSYQDWVLRQDLEGILPSVHAPTRVLYLPTSAIPEAPVRHVAELIPGATFHRLPRTPPGSSIGQALIFISDHVEEAATGSRHSAHAERYLGTVLFTDVVSSTELLERVGDSAYRQLRSDHERAVRLAVETAGGRLVDVAGDGTLSVFDSPTKAVRCAATVCRVAEDAGIAVRAGIHTGELEPAAMGVTGITVHIGARVAAAAGAGEVLVSRTVYDLVRGSGLTFASRGPHELKGVSGTWELFAVTNAGEQPQNLPREEPMQTAMDKIVLRTARAAPALVRSAARLGNAIERRRARSSN